MSDERPTTTVSVAIQIEPMQASGDLQQFAEVMTRYLADNLSNFADVRGADVFVKLAAKRGDETAGHEFRSGHYVKSGSAVSPWTGRMSDERPEPVELYAQAEREFGGDDDVQRAAVKLRYRGLLREHGHLIPGEPRSLPCGWPGPAVSPWTGRMSDERPERRRYPKCEQCGHSVNQHNELGYCQAKVAALQGNYCVCPPPVPYGSAVSP